MKFTAILISLMFSLGAHAAGGLSAKKLEANSNRITPPQVLEKGDSTIGLRANQGDAFHNSPLVGVTLEHMISPNFGIGGLFGYSTYNVKVRTAGLEGTWEHDAYVYAALGSFHFDLFKVKNLDTYISAGVGRTDVRGKWTSKDNVPESGELDADSTYLLGSFNLRYFIDSKFAFNAALGTSIGTLALGMDYLF